MVKSEGSNMSNGKDNEQYRKLFIGGLSMQTSDENLKSFYQQYGNVTDCVVMKDPHTRRSRGFGFVTYTNLDEVDAAMNARPHNIDGKVVDPKRAVPREASQKNEANISTKRLYVSGVRDDHSEQMFEDYFRKYGSVEKVEIIKDKNTGKYRGFAFITFDDYDPVDKACLDRQHMVGGHRCDVKKALSKEEITKAQQMDRDRAERGNRSRGNTRGQQWMPPGGGGAGGDRWNSAPVPGGYAGPPQQGGWGGPPQTGGYSGYPGGWAPEGPSNWGGSAGPSWQQQSGGSWQQGPYSTGPPPTATWNHPGPSGGQWSSGSGNSGRY